MNNKMSNSHHIYTNFSSITPSGFFGYGPENIFEIENFMTQNEIDYLENFSKNNTMWDITEDHVNENGTVIYESDFWKDRVATLDTLRKSDPHVVEVIESLIDRLQKKVEESLMVKVRATGPAVVKWPPGTYQMPHADKELHSGADAGMPNDFPHYDIASLFYFTDDYEGGELFFPVQGIELKPKKGAAYFFPGDMNYIHGVRNIRYGNRFTCPFFWEILEHTGQIKPDYNKKYYRVLLDKDAKDDK